MIVDTSVLFPYFDDRDPDHQRCSRTIDGASDELVVSPYVVAEIDYLVLSRRGGDAEKRMLEELGRGAWELAGFTRDDLARAISVIERYTDQEIGVTDASLVVLADRYRTRTIATLDRRHFEVLRPLSGGRFRLVP